MEGTNYYLRRKKSVGRIFLISLLCSVAGVLLFLWIKNWFLYSILTHFFLNTVMVAGAFGVGCRRYFLENWWTSYLIVILLGGIMQWMQRLPLAAGGFFVTALLAACMLVLLLKLLKRRKCRGNHIYPVKLRQGEKGIELLAYWDSGNQLQDPYNGKYVNILSEKYAVQLLEEETLFRYVPYRSLGETDGMIKVVTVDELLIFDEKQVVHIAHAAVGVAEEKLFAKKEYGMILPAAVLPM